MRMVALWLRWLGLVLLVVAGCKSSEPNLKPPSHPEEYIVPPEAETRFSKPIEFPEGTPKSVKKTSGGGASPLSDPTRFRTGGAGTGRPGY